MGTFFDKPSVTTLLVGDFPIYDNRKKKNKFNKYIYDSEQALINLFEKLLINDTILNSFGSNKLKILLI
jgi:hypothetical protein